jgi:hypothetical protein
VIRVTGSTLSTQVSFVRVCDDRFSNLSPFVGDD